MAGKECVITFKADESLLEAMKGIENRSGFIRSAILSALDNQCPLCRGAGILTPNQMRHWHEFEKKHIVRECQKCHEFHIVCEKDYSVCHEHVSHDTSIKEENEK